MRSLMFAAALASVFAVGCSRSSPTTPAAATQPAVSQPPPAPPTTPATTPKEPEPKIVQIDEPGMPDTVDAWQKAMAGRHHQWPADKIVEKFGPATAVDRDGGKVLALHYRVEKTMKDPLTGSNQTYQWVSFVLGRISLGKYGSAWGVTEVRLSVTR